MLDERGGGNIRIWEEEQELLRFWEGVTFWQKKVSKNGGGGAK